MTPEQRARIERLLDAALDLEEPARSAYIDEACAGDQEIRHLVEELQQGRGRARGFLKDETSTVTIVGPVFRQGQVVIGRFRIVRLQGRGGMGEVYEAWDERLHLRVGLKTIRREQAPNRIALQRFQREIRVAREVAHPNVCRVYDLLEHNEPGDAPSSQKLTTCLTMEWLDGETLQERLRRSRPLSTPDALPIVRQVASALDALHASHVVHRDLKPGNVMMVPAADGGCRVVVTDFGLAKPMSGGQEWFESNVEAPAGSPYFMAPEQLRNEKPTPASDVYAFGLLIDEMVTSSRAFDASSLGALYYQRLWENPIPPGKRCAHLPSNWERAILRCLETEPSARPKSAGEVVRELEGETVAPVPLPRPKARVSRLWLAPLLLLLMMGSAALALRPPRLETSMVVFQIDDLANDPSYAGFSAGMTAELVSRLTKVEGLSVKRFYSVRGKAPLASIAERFHLDGDLQKYQSRIRLNMRLADTSSGDRIVWSESFDRNVDNPLDLEAEVAGRVVDGLETQVLAGASEVARVQYTGFRAVRSLRGLFAWTQVAQAAAPGPAAYHAYLRGRQLFENRDPASVESAIQLFQQAIASAPGYALAHAALADAYRAQIDGRRGPQEDLMEKARQSALEAVHLAPRSPEAYTALAGVQQMEWDWPGSDASYRRAIGLDAQSPVAYRRYGGLLAQFGRFDEALALMRKGLELDPYDYPSQAAYGLTQGLARRFEEAEKQLKWTLSQKDFITPHNNLGFVYVALGKSAQGAEAARFFDLALKETETVRALETKDKSDADAVTPVSDYMFAVIHAARGDAASAREYLRRLENLAQIDRVSPASLAIVYAALNDKYIAVSYLRQAARIKDRGLLYLKVDSRWDPIRDTDGYREVLSKMML
jgi:serine/threonine protein kinase/Tfp pilus assembly protein PilF